MLQPLYSPWIAAEQEAPDDRALNRQGAFGVFLASLFSLMRPMKRLTNVYSINQQAMAAADRIFETLDMPPTISEKPHAITLPKIREGIRFEGVSFKYEDKDVLSI